MIGPQIHPPVRFDDYYLFERLAVGGMAEVFKGVSYGAEGFERLFAVKRVLPHIAEDKEFIEMFIDEAKIASQLQHPNIGQVYHLGRDRRGDYFIAMEFISGRDLRAVYERLRSERRQLSIGSCVYLIKEVCEALDYAHRRRGEDGAPLHLIHRDISPQNILLSYNGSVKLIDFGIAKAAGRINQTQAGVLKGKFSYMSPEQAWGKAIDHRLDLFALAIVFYELLTLERCFLGESDYGTIERVREVQCVPAQRLRPDIPDALQQILDRALSKEIEERFQSAADFQAALLRFLYQHHEEPPTRSGIAQEVQSLFKVEKAEEHQRLQAFRRYAEQLIPEAKGQPGGDQKFIPPVQPQAPSQSGLNGPRPTTPVPALRSTTQGRSLPRFAEEHARLSLSPREERDLHDEHEGFEAAQGASPNLKIRSRLLMLIALFAVSASIALALIPIETREQLSIHAAPGLGARYQLVGGTGVVKRGRLPAMLSDLPAGRYVLTAEAPGMLALQQLVILSKGKREQVRLRFKADPTVAQLALLTRPAGATIELAGPVSRRAQSPGRELLPRGRYQLRVSLPGYKTLTEQVELPGGSLTPLYFTLYPAEVRLRLRLEPPNAQVEFRLAEGAVWGKPSTLNSASLQIPNHGQVQLRISATGYQSYLTTLPLYQKKETTLFVSLVHSSHQKGELSQRLVNEAPKLQVLSPSTVALSVKGATQTSTTPAVTVSPQKSTPEVVVVSTAGSTRGGSGQTTAAAAPQTRKTRNARPRPKRRRRKRRTRSAASPRRTKESTGESAGESEERLYGELRIRSAEICEVSIRGKNYGWTPQVLSLPEGLHRVRFRCNTSPRIDQSVSLSVEAGQSEFYVFKARR